MGTRRRQLSVHQKGTILMLARIRKSMEEKERDEKKKTEVEIAKQKKQKAKLRAK